MNTFIPTGRTSLVKKGDLAIQVQTEYAYRPYPRITTTILNAGQVLHKVEKKLQQPVSSLDEQTRVEGIIKNQHGVVLSAIQEDSPVIQPPAPGLPAEPDRNASEYERLAAIAGVQKVFHLDANGNFIGVNGSEQFQRSFGRIFKNLKDVMDIFVQLPPGDVRENGVYEVERDRLYFVSTGADCYFLAIRRTDGETFYEKAIKEAVGDSPAQI
jgi:hypothetical protein